MNDIRKDSGMDAAPPPTLRDELSALVREANDAGESFQRIADRAVDPESRETLSKPYIQKLARNNVTTTPSPEKLRALAAALRRPLRVVQSAAAAQFLDYRTTELSGYDDDVRIMLAHLGAMPDRERRRWRAMMEADERARIEADKST